MSEKDIIQLVGGEENIQQITHCISRLRFILKDESLVDIKKIKELEIVKGVFSASGVFQIVIGANVPKVFKELIQHIDPSKMSSVKDVTDGGAKSLNFAAKILRMFPAVFMPIIPGIVISGLLLGINNLINLPGLFSADQSLLQLYPQMGDMAGYIGIFASTAFIFLPALVGWSGATYFGGSPLLGIILGLILVHPDLANGWGFGSLALENKIPIWTLFGIDIPKVGYQGSVLPALVAVYVMCIIEKWLRKHVPDVIQLLVVPITTIFVTGTLSFLFIGPITREIGNGLVMGTTWIYEQAPLVGGFLIGSTFAPLVVTGMHHTWLAVNLQMLAQTGETFLWPIQALSDLSQGVAALSMYVLFKNKKMKGIAISSAISAMSGITEPAMFGITLRYRYALLMAMLGAGVGGAFITVMGVTSPAIGVSGLPSFISITTDKIPVYIVGMLITSTITCVGILLLKNKIYTQAEKTGEEI